MNSRCDSLLTELAGFCEHTLVRLGVELDIAKTTGELIADHISDLWGGQQLYIPSNVGKSARAKAQRIIREFTGTNHAALAARHGVSMRRVYMILEDARKKKHAAAK